MTTKTLSPWFVLLLSIATGVCVASNYYAQPLLHTIAHDLHIATSHTGIIITVAQFSYAAGLLLLVPLGDLVERRLLIVSMSFISMLGLIICALSPNMTWLLIGTAIAGFFSVVAQVIIPFAASLANPLERGKVVGMIMSGLLLGILLARTAAGICSYFGDWRTIYSVAAVILFIIILLLFKTLPRYPAPIKMKYYKLIISTLGQFKKYPLLILYSLLGALNFAVFSLLWTPMALLLGGPDYQYSDLTIGLFGLFGAAGALVAPYVGKLADKNKSNLVITLGLTLLILSWLPIGFVHLSIVLLIIGVVTLDLAVQATHVTSMNQVYKIDPNSRNRLNACYMLFYFIGGATASFSSTWLFAHYGWLGVSIAGAGIAFIALSIWLIFHPKQSEEPTYD